MLQAVVSQSPSKQLLNRMTLNASNYFYTRELQCYVQGISRKKFRKNFFPSFPFAVYYELHDTKKNEKECKRIMVYDEIIKGICRSQIREIICLCYRSREVRWNVCVEGA